MKFINLPPENTAGEIAREINNSLQKGSVLLLFSGGSNIKLAIEIRNRLNIKNSLTIGLVDERYGPAGHPDSNWTQLIEAGLNTKDVTLLPVMIGDQPIKATSASYSQRLQNAVKENDMVTAIFGIGTDGHTSGILPGSPTLSSTDIVTYFNGPDFSRITTTPRFMQFIDQAYLVSYGTSKHPQLRRLKNELPVEEQPAQTLKQIDNLIVYSDYNEEI